VARREERVRALEGSPLTEKQATREESRPREEMRRGRSTLSSVV